MDDFLEICILSLMFLCGAFETSVAKSDTYDPKE